MHFGSKYLTSDYAYLLCKKKNNKNMLHLWSKAELSHLDSNLGVDLVPTCHQFHDGPHLISRSHAEFAPVTAIALATSSTYARLSSARVKCPGGAILFFTSN